MIIEHENEPVMEKDLWISGGRATSGAKMSYLWLLFLWTLLIGCKTEVEVSISHLQEGFQPLHGSVLSESHVGSPTSVDQLESSGRLQALQSNLAPPSKLNWASSDNPFHGPIIAPPTFTGQGNCGACWAFVAAHAAQAAVNMAFGEYYRKATAANSHLASPPRPSAGAIEDRGPDKLLVPPLSVQELVDCDDQGYNHACEGGDPYWALYYTLNEGIHAREAYPAYAQEVSTASIFCSGAISRRDAMMLLDRRNAVCPARSIGSTRRPQRMRARFSRCATTLAVCNTCFRYFTRRSAV